MAKYRSGSHMNDFRDNIPKKLMVLGIETPIEIIKMKNFGEWDGNEEKIQLNNANNDQHFKRTLLHEIFHAALAYSGLGETLDEKQEEALCRLVETTYHPIIDFKFEVNGQ